MQVFVRVSGKNSVTKMQNRFLDGEMLVKEILIVDALSTQKFE